MTKVMIIGAGVYQKPLIFRTVERGYETIVVAPEISDDIASAVDVCFYEDVRNEDGILEIARTQNIDAALTDQTDIAVRSVAYVAENLGLPGISYETACLFTDKFLMRERCKQLGIKTLPYQLTTSLEEAMAFFDALDSDAIIKPLDNQGSRGVQRVSTREELKAKYAEAAQYSRNNMVLIEKYATGQEFVVEAACLKGTYRTLICGDTHYFDIPDAFAATSRMFPSEADPSLSQRVEKLNEAVITGFGLTSGLSHSEYVMDENDIYLIESAARGGGVFISSDLIHLGYGLDTEDFLLDIALGRIDALPEPHPLCGACAYMAFFLPAGKVISIEGVDTVQAQPWVHANLLNDIHLGDEILFHYDKTARFAIIVSARDHAQLHEHMNEIKNILKVLVETPSGEYTGIIWE